MAAVGHSVLLVDDVADLRFLLRVVLETDGAFEVVGEAGDGETAIDMCARTRPEVIVLDLSMPTMDGLEALPRLRELAPDATIAVLTGFEGKKIAASAAALGADAYFEKGTPPVAVVDALKGLLGIESAPVESASDGVTRLDESDLRAVVAHDLRSPLTSIIGFGDTLAERWDDIDDDTRRGIVARMTAQARTLHAVTENLLTSTAVELDAVPVNLEPEAPASLLSDLAEVVRPLCGKHALDVRVAPELPPVLVDRVRLQQIVVNLVLNAERHAPPDTPIGLHARADWPWVAIDVVDRGPGIPAAERVRVMEKHVRLARDAKGLGLGLFIATALARAMGGSLFIADPESGPGTRVVCRLRVAEVED
jgi:signal transduction histidine kinase